MTATDPKDRPRGRYKGVAAAQGQRTFKRGEINPKAPKTPEERHYKNRPICGANRSGKSASGPGICCQYAGWGTDHPGTGRCKNHGGTLDQVKKHDELERAAKIVKTFGGPVDVDPHEAMANLIKATAGHVQWMSDMIANFDDPNQLKQYTEAGIRPSVWLEIYQEERRLLMQMSEKAVKAGVAERKVQLSQQMGSLISSAITHFLNNPELEMTPQQMAVAPKLIRQALMAVPNELAPIDDTEQRQAAHAKGVADGEAQLAQELLEQIKAEEEGWETFE